MSRATGQVRKKTTLISMIRDEKGILETFCAHALSLFDRIILIDHLSSDGTREYIKLLSEKHPNIEYYFFEEPGYYQAELMTWAAKNLVNNKAPGWVFILDADEFLPFKSKEEFDRKLSQLGSLPVIFMPWLNLVPLDMESGRVINQFFLKPPKPSRHRKIAFQPSLIPSSHLPIRTKRQLQKKILNGVKSYRHMDRDRNGKIGSHWDEIHQIMEDTSLTNEMMAGIAAQYSDTLHPPYERSLDELRKEGYSELRMEICFSRPMISFDSIAKGRKDGVIGKNDDSSSQSANYRKINFNRSTRSMQITKEREPN